MKNIWKKKTPNKQIQKLIHEETEIKQGTLADLNKQNIQINIFREAKIIAFIAQEQEATIKY